MFDITHFKDYDSIPHQYRLAVSKCIENSFFEGTESGCFDPFGLVPIGQMYKIISYSLNYKKGLSESFLRYMSNSSPFQKMHWATPYVQYCKSLDLYLFDDSATLDANVTIHDAVSISHLLYRFLCKYYSVNYNHDSITISLDDTPIKKISRCEVCQILVDVFCSFWRSILCECISDNKHLSVVTQYVKSLLTDNKSFPFLSLDAKYFIRCLLQQPSSKDIPLEHIQAIFQLQDLKVSKFCVDIPPSVFHFTSIQTLAILSKSSSKLHLTNSAFLNDPSEGTVAKNYLEEYLKMHTKHFPGFRSLINNFLSSKTDTIPISNTYIASFNRMLDGTSLPMWYQYGDKGMGCSIEFSTQSFSVPIYKVFYLPDDLEFFNSFFESVSTIISDKIKNSASEDTSFFKSFLYSFLEQIVFLFKNSCYAHEKEVRAIISCEPQNASIEQELRSEEYFPRTYCESDYEIRSVTFGPKVQNAKQLIVGCASNGLVCTFKHSSLPFQ